MTLLEIILLIFAFAILVFILIGVYFSSTLIYPIIHPIETSPEVYGMEFKQVEFVTEDSVRLKGWYIPGNSEKLVIMGPPGQFSRAGFDPKNQGLVKITDIKVDLIKAMKSLHYAGYSILTFDLQITAKAARVKVKKSIMD